jgi:ABC-type lipoprotein export system ATPase subunit
MTAADNVALPLLAEGLPHDTIRERTEQALDKVGLRHRAAHRPSEMSGGEQQRVGIARALVMEPRLILADEPTGNLDSVAGDEVLALLKDATSSFGVSIVMVTHSYLAASAMDAIATMKDGGLIENDFADIRQGPGLRLVPTPS